MKEKIKNKTIHLLQFEMTILFLIHFLVGLDALAIVPFSSIMTSYVGADTAWSGYLVSAYSISAAITCLCVRGASNIRREKNRMLFFLAGIILTTFFTTLVHDFTTMILCRVLTGIFGGALAVVNLNYVILRSGDENKKRNTAVLMSSLPLALAVGVPLLILLASGENWRLAFQFLSVSLLLVSILFFGVDRSGDKHQIPNVIAQNSGLFSVSDAIKSRTVWFSIILAFSAILGTFAVSTQFPVMLSVNLGISPNLLSICYLMSGVGAFAAVQFYGRTKANERNVGLLILLLSIAMIVTVISGFQTKSVELASIAFSVFVVVSSTRTLVLVTELICALPARERVFLISAQNSIQHLAVGVGGMLSSLVIYSKMDSTLDFSPLLYISSLLALSTPIIWYWYKKQ
ncbi:MFS transporter [Vibrio nigripulchritudo]|uniref:MFS transporter n=1 Tax=Vibrio nigripulchritudo TaxID=28173 RepID=UPI00190A7ACA|nr:MFS transporter [Vibrio nigripulchritudo]